MKAFLRASLLALAVAAIPTLAHAWSSPYSLNLGVKFYSNGYPGCSPQQLDIGIKIPWGCNPCCAPGCYGYCPPPQAGPWYLYYPYEAYFQTPAPMGDWPYWPTQTPVAVPPAGYMPGAAQYGHGY